MDDDQHAEIVQADELVRAYLRKTQDGTIGRADAQLLVVAHIRQTAAALGTFLALWSEETDEEESGAVDATGSGV